MEWNWVNAGVVCKVVGQKKGADDSSTHLHLNNMSFQQHDSLVTVSDVFIQLYDMRKNDADTQCDSFAQCFICSI